MLTVSEALQRARLDQGIDLATVAARTKIKARYLQAIEAGDRQESAGRVLLQEFRSSVRDILRGGHGSNRR